MVMVQNSMEKFSGLKSKMSVKGPFNADYKMPVCLRSSLPFSSIDAFIYCLLMKAFTFFYI